MHTGTSAPMEGRTNWKVFGAVTGGGLTALGAMTGLMMNGMVALALDVPVPFTVQADSISGSTFSLVPEESPNGAGGAKVSMSGDLTNLAITKTVELGSLGSFDVVISAGTGRTPAHADGMIVYAESIGSDLAKFDQGLTMDANKSSLSAPSMNLTKATLQVPYLSTNQITLPGMSLKIQHHSGNNTGS